MLNNLRKKDVLMHLFFVFLFLIVPALVFERLPGESVFTFTRVIIQDTIANFILLCFFYLNYYVLIPKFYFTHKYVQYVLYVILFLGITLPLPHLIGNILPMEHPGPPGFPHDAGPFNDHPPGDKPGHLPIFEFSIDEFRRHLYLFFTAVFFSFLLRTREHLSHLKEEKLNAELSSLKSQINPHFLFNTLNSIYSLSIKKDDKTSDAIIHLAGLMRYATKDANDDAIPLQKELEYITNYIELQKARLGNTVAIHFECTGNGANKKITPLILITYIENAFKYGVNPDTEECTIDIKIQIREKGITLQTKNKKVQASSLGDSTGIGMKNTKERLKHLYPQKHNLQVEETNDYYSLTLTLELV